MARARGIVTPAPPYPKAATNWPHLTRMVGLGWGLLHPAATAGHMHMHIAQHSAQVVPMQHAP